MQACGSGEHLLVPEPSRAMAVSCRHGSPTVCQHQEVQQDVGSSAKEAVMQMCRAHVQVQQMRQSIEGIPDGVHGARKVRMVSCC